MLALVRVERRRSLTVPVRAGVVVALAVAREREQAAAALALARLAEDVGDARPERVCDALGQLNARHLLAPLERADRGTTAAGAIGELAVRQGQREPKLANARSAVGGRRYARRCRRGRLRGGFLHGAGA